MRATQHLVQRPIGEILPTSDFEQADPDWRILKYRPEQLFPLTQSLLCALTFRNIRPTTYCGFPVASLSS